MSNSFQFKQFAVNQTDVAMKVGTDGVLLGAWVDVAAVERVLDIGTGTGVIALMMAQRSESQTIVGVDIDPQAAQCAAKNFIDSPWSDRLQALHTSVQEYEGGTFDLVISNPPYFTNSLLCPDSSRTTARHTTSLSFEDLDSAVCKMVDKEHGRFALILPTEQMERFLEITNLKVVRRCDVRSKAGGKIIRVMAELAFAEREQDVVCENLIIYADSGREYTEQYRALTKDFYLKF